MPAAAASTHPSGETDAALTALGYIASAICGRALNVAWLVTGRLSYCDTSTIFVDPALPLDRAAAVTVLHALLATAGSLDYATTRKLRPMSGDMSRYLTLEAQRSGRTCDLMAPRSFTEAMSFASDNPVSASREESLRIARDAAQPITPLANWYGTIHPSRLPRRPTPLPLVDAWHGGENNGTAGDSASGDADRFLGFLSSPASSGSALGDLLATLLGGGRSGVRKADDGAASGDVRSPVQSASGGGRRSMTSLPSRGRKTSGEGFSDNAPTPFAYPEWNETRRRYLDNWAHVHEVRPGVPQTMTPAEPCLLDRPLLQKQLFRVGAEHEMHRRQYEGDDLDLDRVVEFAAELRMHQSARENVYRKSMRTKRDLSVIVLLDISRSTSEKNSHGGSVFGQQREVARTITETFFRFGDQVALYAFHSMGRKLIRFLKVKGFDERFTAESCRRLNQLEPGGLTRLGAAVRHGAHVLLSQRRNTHRLIIMLSDGFAYDEGYEGPYAEADTAKALEEARLNGIACVCVTIGGSTSEEACKRIYGEAGYLLCAEPAELPGKLGPLLNAALRAASTSQRGRLQRASHLNRRGAR